MTSMSPVARSGIELWLLGAACLLLSFTPLPGAVTVGAAADLFGVSGLLLTAGGVLPLQH